MDASYYKIQSCYFYDLLYDIQLVTLTKSISKITLRYLKSHSKFKLYMAPQISTFKEEHMARLQRNLEIQFPQLSRIKPQAIA